MVVLAGPNGAGKSTVYRTQIAPTLRAPFINADEIQRDELGNPSLDAAYEAARIADARRDAALRAGQSFATETVFSHPSKLDLVTRARKAGFAVVVLHVGIETADLAVARVLERVVEGGHPVPENKIRARFRRNGALIRQAVLIADQGHVFDNSGWNTPPRRVLRFARGRIVEVDPPVPPWVGAIYAPDITRRPPQL